MRKLGMCTLILMVGVGMIVMGGCSDSDSATSLPQSAASYMGSNMPANIDSNTGSNYYDLYKDVLNPGSLEPANDSGSMQMSSNVTVEGDIGGTYTYTWSNNMTWGPTGSTYTFSHTFVYDNWENSGDGEPNYTMRGSGSEFFKQTQNEKFDGVVSEEPVPEQNGGGIGTYLGRDEMTYVNFSDFAESTSDMDPYMDPFDKLNTGWASQKSSYLESPREWSENQDANIAYNNFTDEGYSGLLNSTAAAGYDGSVTTLMAAGGLCEEGIPFGIEGCLDYEMDLLWHGDAKDSDAWPDDGTTTIDNTNFEDGTAVAVYDYSAYAGTCASIRWTRTTTARTNSRLRWGRLVPNSQTDVLTAVLNGACHIAGRRAKPASFLLITPQFRL